MMKRLGLLGVLVMFAVALVLSAAPQHAFAKHGGKEGRAKGPITAIDTTASTVTINDRKQGSVTVTVNDATELRLDNNKNATLAMLAVGDRADARYDTTTMVASRIKAKTAKIEAKVEGVITAIDLDAGSVTIQPSAGDPVTVTVTATTKIEYNEADATLADFQIGDAAQAKYNPTNFVASKIEGMSN